MSARTCYHLEVGKMKNGITVSKKLRDVWDEPRELSRLAAGSS